MKKKTGTQPWFINANEHREHLTLLQDIPEDIVILWAETIEKNRCIGNSGLYCLSENLPLKDGMFYKLRVKSDFVLGICYEKYRGYMLAIIKGSSRTCEECRSGFVMQGVTSKNWQETVVCPECKKDK